MLTEEQKRQLELITTYAKLFVENPWLIQPLPLSTISKILGFDLDRIEKLLATELNNEENNLFKNIEKISPPQFHFQTPEKRTTFINSIDPYLASDLSSIESNDHKVKILSALLNNAIHYAIYEPDKYSQFLSMLIEKGYLKLEQGRANLLENFFININSYQNQIENNEGLRTELTDIIKMAETSSETQINLALETFIKKIEEVKIFHSDPEGELFEMLEEQKGSEEQPVPKVSEEQKDHSKDLEHELTFRSGPLVAAYLDKLELLKSNLDKCITFGLEPYMNKLLGLPKSTGGLNKNAISLYLQNTQIDKLIGTGFLSSLITEGYLIDIISDQKALSSMYTAIGAEKAALLNQFISKIELYQSLIQASTIEDSELIKQFKEGIQEKNVNVDELLQDLIQQVTKKEKEYQKIIEDQKQEYQKIIEDQEQGYQKIKENEYQDKIFRDQEQGYQKIIKQQAEEYQKIKEAEELQKIIEHKVKKYSSAKQQEIKSNLKRYAELSRLMKITKSNTLKILLDANTDIATTTEASIPTVASTTTTEASIPTVASTTTTEASIPTAASSSLGRPGVLIEYIRQGGLTQYIRQGGLSKIIENDQVLEAVSELEFMKNRASLLHKLSLITDLYTSLLSNDHSIDEQSTIKQLNDTINSNTDINQSITTLIQTIIQEYRNINMLPISGEQTNIDESLKNLIETIIKAGETTQNVTEKPTNELFLEMFQRQIKVLQQMIENQEKAHRGIIQKEEAKAFKEMSEKQANALQFEQEWQIFLEKAHREMNEQQANARQLEQAWQEFIDSPKINSLSKATESSNIADAGDLLPGQAPPVVEVPSAKKSPQPLVRVDYLIGPREDQLAMAAHGMESKEIAIQIAHALDWFSKHEDFESLQNYFELFAYLPKFSDPEFNEKLDRLYDQDPNYFMQLLDVALSKFHNSMMLINMEALSNMESMTFRLIRNQFPRQKIIKQQENEYQNIIAPDASGSDDDLASQGSSVSIEPKVSMEPNEYQNIIAPDASGSDDDLASQGSSVSIEPKVSMEPKEIAIQIAHALDWFSKHPQFQSLQNYFKPFEYLPKFSDPEFEAKLNDLYNKDPNYFMKLLDFALFKFHNSMMLKIIEEPSNMESMTFRFIRNQFPTDSTTAKIYEIYQSDPDPIRESEQISSEQIPSDQIPKVSKKLIETIGAINTNNIDLEVYKHIDSVVNQCFTPFTLEFAIDTEKLALDKLKKLKNFLFTLIILSKDSIDIYQYLIASKGFKLVSEFFETIPPISNFLTNATQTGQTESPNTEEDIYRKIIENIEKVILAILGNPEYLKNLNQNLDKKLDAFDKLTLQEPRLNKIKALFFPETANTNSDTQSSLNHEQAKPNSSTQSSLNHEQAKPNRTLRTRLIDTMNNLGSCYPKKQKKLQHTPKEEQVSHQKTKNRRHIFSKKK